MAQILCVILRYRRDGRNKGSGDHVCGVEAATESDFQHDDVAAVARKKPKGKRRDEFKFGGVGVTLGNQCLNRLPYFGKALGPLFGGEKVPVDLRALQKVFHVGGDE